MSYVLPYGVECSETDMMLMPGCALCEIRFLLLTCHFKLETSEWSLDPLEPSPRLMAPFPARKKSNSSNNGQNREIARTLFQSTEPGTCAEPLLPDPLDKLLPHAFSVVHHVPVVSSEKSVSTAPSRISSVSKWYTTRHSKQGRDTLKLMAVTVPKENIKGS